MIAAEGEQKASRALREASEVIAESSAALQLRYLQVSSCSTAVLQQLYSSDIYRCYTASHKPAIVLAIYIYDGSTELSLLSLAQNAPLILHINVYNLVRLQISFDDGRGPATIDPL